MDHLFRKINHKNYGSNPIKIQYIHAELCFECCIAEWMQTHKQRCKESRFSFHASRLFNNLERKKKSPFDSIPVTVNAKYSKLLHTDPIHREQFTELGYTLIKAVFCQPQQIMFVLLYHFLNFYM